MVTGQEPKFVDGLAAVLRRTRHRTNLIDQFAYPLPGVGDLRLGGKTTEDEPQFRV